MSLNATIERLDNHRVALKVEVGPEVVDRALDRAYRRLVRRVTIPGFRKGKAPRSIFERFVGRAALWDEAMDEMVADAYLQAVRETGIEPIDQPKIDLQPDYDANRVAFRAEVLVKPEVQLGDYRSLRLEPEPAAVSEEDVDEALERLREQRAELVAVEDGRPVQPGDFVVIDFQGRLADGTPIERGAAEGYLVEIGAGQLLEGIEDGIVGMRVDETKDIPAKFPEDYGVDELAGKEAVFSVTVREIKERRLPELNDDFAREAGPYASLEELRAELKNSLERSARERAEREFRDRLVERVVEEASVDLPEALVERRLAQLRASLERRLAERGLTLEAYLKASETTPEALEADLRRQAERDVKTDLVLDAVAKAEGIEVGENELREEVERIARSYGSSAAQVRRLILQNPDNVADVRASLRVRRTVDRLAELARAAAAAPEEGAGQPA
ncbi:MAG: trigger factor [Firmicutes bacterium]|nr:trigger factor [Bacillota bacterium]